MNVASRSEFMMRILIAIRFDISSIKVKLAIGYAHFEKEDMLLGNKHLKNLLLFVMRKFKGSQETTAPRSSTQIAYS